MDGLSPVVLIVGALVVIVLLVRDRDRDKTGAIAGWGQDDLLPAHLPDTLTRMYRGTAETANRAFQADAAELAKHGYVPVNQSYIRGSWGCGAFLVALVLCLVLVGILVFIYMLLVPPAGVLTVTYHRSRGDTPAPTKAAESMSLTDQIARLGELRDRGILTTEEFESKKAELLGRM